MIKGVDRPGFLGESSLSVSLVDSVPVGIVFRRRRYMCSNFGVLYQYRLVILVEEE